MSIRLFNVVGVGFVISETIVPPHNHHAPQLENDCFFLKYPARIQFIPDQRIQGQINMVCDALVPEKIGAGGPPLLMNAHVLMEKFPLKKSMIIFKGKPSREIAGLYEQFTKNYRKVMTGIEVVGAGALNNLPGPGRAN